MTKERTGQQARGEVRKSKDGKKFSTLIRTWKDRETFQLPTCRTEPEAEARSLLLADVAKRFRDAAVNRARGDECLAILASAPTTEKSTRNAIGLCEDLLGGKIPSSDLPSAPTFAEVATDWTTGKIAKLHPDHVKRTAGEDQDGARLERLCATPYGGKTIGDVPIDRFTLDHAEVAMRGLPKSAKRPATRRQYAQLIHRVLGLAVYPLRIINANPLPRGFMPKLGKPPARAFLYPTEDALLMAHTGNPEAPGTPLAYRLLYGFLAREGCRLGEAVALRWRDLDLERGVITLDRNKTDDARAWALDPGVVRALRAWRKMNEDSALVFVHEGGVIGHDQLAEKLRASLLAAGVKRSEIHTPGENRGMFRVHDLRGTFVTLSLANGKSETWVADRTGHTSSQMINRYRRAARSAQELSLGQLVPLDMAIPELAGDAPIVLNDEPISSAPVVPQQCHSEPTRGDDGERGDDVSSGNSMIPAGFAIEAPVFNPKVPGSIPGRPTISSEVTRCALGRLGR